MLAVLVADGDDIVISPATARSINKCPVVHARLRRQLQRPPTLNRAVDQRIIEERRKIGPELGIPLRACGGRIGKPLCRNDTIVQARVEQLRAALHDQNVIAVNAEMPCASDARARCGGTAS